MRPLAAIEKSLIAIQTPKKRPAGRNPRPGPLV